MHGCMSEVAVEVKQDRRLVNNTKLSLSLSLWSVWGWVVCVRVHQEEEEEEDERRRDEGRVLLLLRGCRRRPSVVRPMKWSSSLSLGCTAPAFHGPICHPSGAYCCWPHACMCEWIPLLSFQSKDANYCVYLREANEVESISKTRICRH